jgi:uncharacterized membrane protein (UPF0182 family)
LTEVGTSGLVGWVFALASANWDTYLRFQYGGSYGLRDPLFAYDVGFYLFQLPFYELEQSSLAYLTLVTLAAVVAAYLIPTSFQAVAGGARIPGSEAKSGIFQHSSLFSLGSRAGASISTATIWSIQPWASSMEPDTPPIT